MTDAMFGRRGITPEGLDPLGEGRAMEGHEGQPGRRAFRGAFDRRLVRSAIYSVVTILLFLAFKTSEWFIEHYIAGGKGFSVPIALGVAVALGAVFQVFHHRVEHAATAFLYRKRTAREHGLKELARELPLIHDVNVMTARVVERLDLLLGLQGTRLYALTRDEGYKARAPGGAQPATVSTDDPLAIRLALARAPVEPAGLGSSIDAAIACPLMLRGQVAGFIAVGHPRKSESLEDAELAGINHVAEAAATALAFLDPEFARDSAGIAPADTPNNLPVPVSRLIGREREVEEILAKLETARLVTLLGTGGLGKTRMALEIATKWKASSPDGVWWIELSPLAEPARVVEATASAMGVKEVAGEGLLEGLARHAKTRRMMVVLDNCEHVVEACAEVANRLLQAAPHVRILTTSREPLHVTGEIAYAMPSLSDDESVRLFVERATAVMPQFKITEANAATVAGICARLDGIALAIELAASRVRAMTVDQLAARLGDRFRLLVGEDKTRPTRQQTLRASIAWSYDLLPDAERLVLQRLSTFSGGWTLESAEDVASGGEVASRDVLDLLAHLVDKSLVSMNADGRYRLMDSVRDYAREQLEATGQLAQARDRHLAHFLAFAEKATPELVGPGQAAWFARIDAELENVLAAHEWCQSASTGAGDGLRLILAIRFYWFTRGLMGLGYRLSVEALARPGARDAGATACRTLITTGQIAYFLGRYAEARPYLEEGLEAARRLKDPERCCVAMRNLGMVCIGLNDLESAQVLLEEALALARTLPSIRELASETNAVAQLHFMKGDLAAAEPLFRESLAHARTTGEGEVTVTALCALAMVAIERGGAREAATLLLEALEEGGKIGSRPAVVFVLATCVPLASLLGRWDDAACFHGAYEAQLEQTGLRPDPADKAFINRGVAKARAALAPEAYAAASDAGARCDVDQAKAAARQWLATATA